MHKQRNKKQTKQEEAKETKKHQETVKKMQSWCEKKDGLGPPA
jgi:hypothetical protein